MGLEEAHLPSRLTHMAGKLVLAVGWELSWAIGLCGDGGQIAFYGLLQTPGLPLARTSRAGVI